MHLRFFCLFLAIAASPAAEPAPELTIHLHNLAQAPDAELTRAIGITTKIFAAAGVTLEWRQEDAPSISGPTHLSVWLLGDDLADRAKPNREVLGEAFPAGEDGHRTVAALYYGRIRHMAKQTESPAGSVLGALMTHELGHLLLGNGAHANSGVMVARWEVADFRAAEKGWLRFVKDQAERIRRDAEARQTGKVTGGE